MRSLFDRTVVGLAILGLHVPAVAGMPRIATKPVHDVAALFGARPAVSGMALSPDGTRVLYLAPDGGEGTAVMIAASDGSAPGKVIARSAAAASRITGCDFASNDRVVCTALVIAPSDGLLLGYQRLIAFDADGTHTATLATGTSGYELRSSQYDGGVIDWMKGDTGRVLIQRDHIPERDIGTRLAHTRDGLGVDMVDTRSLRSVRVEDAEPSAAGYLSDGAGVVRMRKIVPPVAGGLISPTTVWSYRRKGDRRWIPFSTTREDGPGLRPVAIDPDLDVVYCLDKLDRRDALYRVSLDGAMRRELAYADPSADVVDVVRIGRQPRVVGALTASDRRSVHYFDPATRAFGEALSKALPTLPIVDFVSASSDGSKLLIFAGSDVDPGRYYVFDRATKHLAEIALARPELEHATLLPMKPVAYRAADGTPIPAYLTMPAGGGGRDLPAIVLPHGGPAARDDWGFDWLPQYFAARGFVVLQPEYRGSTGYGDDWQVGNGFRSWRTAIGDVADAGRWLVAQGIADPSRLAIVGWSYGGYAALQSQVIAPGLFKASVAIAPVTDFGALRAEGRGFVDAAIKSDYIGTDAASSAAGSPARYAADFKAPVALFHGTLDQNVSVAESQLMDDRLKAAGKQSMLVIYPGLDHGLPSGEIRADMLRRSDAFLRTALKMPAASPPS